MNFFRTSLQQVVSLSILIEFFSNTAVGEFYGIWSFCYLVIVDIVIVDVDAYCTIGASTEAQK